MRKIEIDGVEHPFADIGAAHPNGQWAKIHVYGPTLSGRIAPVSQHTIPATLLIHGGACITGGHTYRIKGVMP